MVLEPLLGLLASVFGIIILLEDDALGASYHKMQGCFAGHPPES